MYNSDGFWYNGTEFPTEGERDEYIRELMEEPEKIEQEIKETEPVEVELKNYVVGTYAGRGILYIGHGRDGSRYTFHKPDAIKFTCEQAKKSAYFANLYGVHKWLIFKLY